MRLHYTLILSALLLFVTLPSFSQAQDRVEADDFVFNSKSSQMNSASYWSYDDFDLKWKEDRLPDEISYLQSFTCEFEGRPYFVLLWAFRVGEYEYEAIQEGWHTHPEYMCLIFEEDEWLKYSAIDSCRSVTMAATYSTTDIRFFGQNYNANDFVRRAFLQKSQFQQDHTLYIALTKDGNIRFDRRPLENSKHYFETSRSDFDSIMISYPSEKKYKSITVNPGRSDYETRRNLGIGAAVGGCLLGIFLGLVL